MYTSIFPGACAHTPGVCVFICMRIHRECHVCAHVCMCLGVSEALCMHAALLQLYFLALLWTRGRCPLFASHRVQSYWPHLCLLSYLIRNRMFTKWQYYPGGNVGLPQAFNLAQITGLER